MRRTLLSQIWGLAWMGLVLPAFLGAASPAWAEIPWLAVRLVGGETAVYPIHDVNRIGFEGDTLVVAHAGGAESYGAATITRIEFLWSPVGSGVNDPRDAAALVRAVHLFQNQPNPFSPETRIAFDLPHAGPVELVIYSVNGRLIRRLVKESREAGRHTASWDGRDDAGEKVGSGIYFYQLIAPGVDESRRMILLP
ncbi:MAG: FlgD immunoglobulin-like domain containing protein [bacterium]